MTALHDMHCHLDFMANGAEVAQDARKAGALIFANTVTPQGYFDACERFDGMENVAVGFGMHPWWVKSGAETAEANQPQQAPRETGQRAQHRKLAEQAAADDADHPLARQQREQVLDLLARNNPQIVGEIGLDFGWQHVGSRNAQLALFEAILAWCAEEGGKLISIHSVKSAPEAVRALEASGATDSCSCIFHWFTGPSDLLKRAIDAGCFFSCGPRMLSTKKGREYIKAIPVKQLLLETDEPAAQGDTCSYAQLRETLESAAQGIAAIKGPKALEVIASTSSKLLNG